MTVLCQPTRLTGWMGGGMSSSEDELDRTIVMRKAVARGAAVNIGHYLAFSQDAELRRVPIAPGGLVIGRSPPAALVIPAPDISRKHCRIDIEGDRAMITDLDSTNGTFVGGERVEQPTRLRNGSQLSLGSFPIRYERRDKSEVAEEARARRRAAARRGLRARHPAAADHHRAGADRMVVRAVVPAWRRCVRLSVPRRRHLRRLRARRLGPRHRLGDARGQRGQRAAPAGSARRGFPRSRRRSPPG